MSWVNAIIPVLGKYVYPTAMLVQTLSIYMTLLVAGQRYACLCRPYRASLYCQRQQTRRYVIGITVFSVLFTLPRYFEYDAVQSEVMSTTVWNDTTAPATTTTEDVLVARLDVEQTNFTKNHIYRIVYFNLHPIKPADDHVEVENDQCSVVSLFAVDTLSQQVLVRVCYFNLAWLTAMYTRLTVCIQFTLLLIYTL